MKTRFAFLTLIVFLSVIVELGCPVGALAAPQEPVSAPSLQPIVHIIHARLQNNGGQNVIRSSESLGTVIGPHVILTHNHFGAALGTQADERFTFTDSTGKVFSAPVAEVERTALGGGTLLLRLPDTVSLAALPLADRADINRLAAGNWLTVNYWDDANQRLATRDFQLIKMANGIATLADPGRVINRGDSGGGVFFNGRLIGNTWSYNADANRNSLGSFNVALLPAQVAALN